MSVDDDEGTSTISLERCSSNDFEQDFTDVEQENCCDTCQNSVTEYCQMIVKHVTTKYIQKTKKPKLFVFRICSRQ